MQTPYSRTSLLTQCNVCASCSPKDIPWFVSDTLPFDFVYVTLQSDLEITSSNPDRRVHGSLHCASWAIDSLGDKAFFAQHSDQLDDGDLETLARLSARWQDHLSTGRFKLAVPPDTPLGGAKTGTGHFWTTQYPYSLMPEMDPALLDYLASSGLVILKGDLNYRK